MAKNKNQKKPKASSRPGIANDQIGENAGYEQQMNQLKGNKK